MSRGLLTCSRRDSVHFNFELGLASSSLVVQTRYRCRLHRERRQIRDEHGDRRHRSRRRRSRRRSRRRRVLAKGFADLDFGIIGDARLIIIQSGTVDPDGGFLYLQCECIIWTTL